ncbi:DMT family transporter [Camelimonas abortus]|uniref:DMT family transporter n=1 Tax=Camelimonas abortus TaxID=1017184 RepID=A0ABV7LCM3_9HYPH
MTAQTPPAAARSAPAGSVRLGALLMVAAVFLFSLNDVLGKWLVASYPVGQMLVMRSLVCLVILAPFYVRSGLAPLRQASRPWLHVIRGLLTAAEVGLFYASVIWLPLADAVTFYMAGPIYVAALAALALGERAGTGGWLAIIAGFTGVAVALEPGGASFTWPALIALAGSILFAVSMIITRYLRGAPDVVLVTGTVLGGLVLGVALLPFSGWRPAPAVDLALMGWLGVVAMAGHACVNRSLKLAPATTVVPYQYLLIVFAMFLGWLAFGETPALTATLGAAIIVGAGLAVFLQEKRNAALQGPPET